MGYKSSPFKMAPKSPMLKALKGNQGKLPQQLQDAIKAAPESPAKQTKEYSDKGTKLRAKAEKASAKGRDKKAVKLNTKADKYDKKQVSGLMGSLEKGGAFDTKSPAKNYKNGYYGK